MTCDACGRELSPGGFYVARVEVVTDPAMPPIDTTQPAAESVDDLIAELSDFTEQELLDQVFRRSEHRLCPPCAAEVAANPLGLPRRRRPSRN